MSRRHSRKWPVIIILVLFLLVTIIHDCCLPCVAQAAARTADDDDSDVLPESHHQDGEDADQNDNDNDPLTQFLHACSQGDLKVVDNLLDENPDFANKRSPEGETCLHVAGIYGQTDITLAVLKAGGNPNIRSTFSQGLRMTPLSWNVYGGHVETVRALLDGGANVNLDFDKSMQQHDELRKVTVLDVLYSDILDHAAKNPDDDNPQMKKYYDMKDLLLKYGARRYADLEEEDEEEREL